MAAARRRQVAGLERRDRPADLAGEHVAGDVGDAIDGEAELLEDRAGRRRRAEVVEPDDRALVADLALPAERDAGLDRDPLAGRRAAARDSRYAASWRSNSSQQGSETTRLGTPSLLERLGRAERELELRAGADEDHLAAPGPPDASRRT